MLVAPSRKQPTFIFGSIGSGDLHDIRDAKRTELANLRCPSILIREPPANELKSSPLAGSVKTATRFEIPLWTRSAASSAAAPPESTDKTMMSADATGSFTTSTHPAARRTGSRRERIATIASAANPSTTKIVAHLGHLKIIPRFTSQRRRWLMPRAIGQIPWDDPNRAMAVSDSCGLLHAKTRRWGSRRSANYCYHGHSINPTCGPQAYFNRIGLHIAIFRLPKTAAELPRRPILHGLPHGGANLHASRANPSGSSFATAEAAAHIIRTSAA